MIPVLSNGLAVVYGTASATIAAALVPLCLRRSVSARVTDKLSVANGSEVGLTGSPWSGGRNRDRRHSLTMSPMPLSKCHTVSWSPTKLSSCHTVLWSPTPLSPCHTVLWSTTCHAHPAMPYYSDRLHTHTRKKLRKKEKNRKNDRFRKCYTHAFFQHDLCELGFFFFC